MNDTMRRFDPRGGQLAFALALCAAWGCSGGSITGTPSGSGNGTAGAGGALANAGGTRANAGTGNGVSFPTAGVNAGGATSLPSGGGTSLPGAGANAGGSTPLPMGVDPLTLIPERIRRLANAEFDASVQVLTATAQSPGQAFAPDARQDGFTLNDAQRVDNVTAKQIFAAATDISAALDVTKAAPCADMTKSDACARAFIASYGQKAYRRPLSSDESAGLFTVYQTGEKGATYADGIRLVVRALINSAGFLYLTELGDGAAAATGTAVALTPYELASSLAYLVTNAPPDDQLLADALAGALATPEGRATAFWRLIGTASARDRVIRVVREWLGVDRLAITDKDATAYPAFAGLKAAMDAESIDFITSLIADSSGNIDELLSANWTKVNDPKLAQLYGASGSGRITLPTRRGILNQAAFLSVFAHASESGPVLRGVDMARRVACIDIPSPTTLNIQVIPPLPDPKKTTRERFQVHATDALCAGCHDTIDAFGFAFEEYDGMGQFRSMEAGKAVDSSVVLKAGTDFDGSYADGNALSIAMSKSAQVRTCFARHMFRASAGRSDSSVTGTEQAFLSYWQALPADQQGNILQTLLTFVQSPLFTHRRAP